MRTLLCLLALSVSTAALATPVQLTHTGRLFDATGVPLTGPHDLSITLYDASAGGTEQFSEDFSQVEVDDGFFSVVIGTDINGNVLDSTVFSQASSALFVAMSVDSGAELPGRFVLTAVPTAAFALEAATAETATNLSGGAIDATSISVDGAPLAAIALSGSYSDLGDVPADLADGDDDTQLDEAAVDAFVSNNGYASAGDLATVATSGAFSDLSGIPAGLADGDDDTQLDEAAVDAFVANNGYASAGDLATVATSGAFSDLTGIPSGLADGDNDTTYTAGAGIALSGTEFAVDEAALVTALNDDFVSDADAFTAADAVAAMATLDGGILHFDGNVNALPANYTAGFAGSDGGTIRAGHNTGGEVSTLFLMTNDNTNDSVYIGGSGQQCCGGAPWRGLRVFGTGNASLSGALSSGVGQQYSDLAENVPTAMNVGPGDVVTVNPDGGSYPNTGFLLASQAYDTRVVGVITDSATVTMADAAGRQPLALSGMVKVKVDARYGAIQPGDLLTASATPGHAMRADEDVPGAIVGKALEPLDAGTGRVLMLVMNR